MLFEDLEQSWCGLSFTS